MTAGAGTAAFFSSPHITILNLTIQNPEIKNEGNELKPLARVNDE